MSQVRTCPKCGTEHAENRYFCKKCGALLEPDRFSSEAVYEEAELKVMRILENLQHTPHSSILMPSAAYIYNLCRDYETLSSDERIPLMMFALSMKKDISRLEACLPEMVELTNIDSIKGVIEERLAGNYQTLLCQDIGRKYLDIVYTLRRIAQEDEEEKQEIIRLSNADIRKLNDKLAEQKRNYDQILANQQQLEALMNTVEKSTQERLAQTLMMLRETKIVGTANSHPGKQKTISRKGGKKR